MSALGFEFGKVFVKAISNSIRTIFPPDTWSLCQFSIGRSKSVFRMPRQIAMCVPTEDDSVPFGHFFKSIDSFRRVGKVSPIHHPVERDDV